MRLDNPARTKLAALLLVLTALFAHTRAIVSLVPFDAKSSGRDEVTLYEQRLADLRQMLPSRGVVGYFFESADWKRWDWNYTQYALAPVILDRNTDHELVIGNFPDGKISPAASTNSMFRLVRDFGNGLMLFRNEAK